MSCTPCQGSGKRSNGQPCFPCKGTGEEINIFKPHLGPYATAFGDRELQQQQAGHAVAQLQTITIDSDAGYQQAAEWLKWFKRNANAYESKRKAMTGPLLESKREIDSWFKPIVSTWVQAEQILKSKLQDYQARQLAQRQNIAQQMQAQRGNVPQTMALAAKAQLTIVPDVHGLSERKVLKWDIENVNLIPREFWVLDSVKIKQAMRKGVTIPGVRYYQETSLAVKVK